MVNKGVLFKRLSRELEILIKKYKKVLVYTTNDDDTNILINLSSTLNIKILLSDGINSIYPFIIPFTYINNIKYDFYINNFSKKYSILINILNIPCPCCFSIISSFSVRWDPSYTLDKIIDEYIYNLKLFNILIKLNYIRLYLDYTFKHIDNKFILKNIYNYLEF